MTQLDWLMGHRFTALHRREFDWVFTFDHDVSVVTACLWRLLEGDRIRITSRDEGQQFGLPAPVDPNTAANTLLSDATIAAVELKAGTLDLRIHFSTGHALELIPDSSGYEAWNISRENQQFIATGGGELVTFGNEP